MADNKIKILVIDDDRVWQGRLQRMLVRSDYRVCVASNIKEAEEALAREGAFEFDLVTVDMHLTEESGEG